MRIGLNSLIGDGFGTGSFSFGEVPSGGGGIPPEGFSSMLYGQEYPIAEGGEFFVHPIDGSDVPSEVCDVEVWHDGLGGFYTNWSTASNVDYKANTVAFDTATETQTPVADPYFGYYYDSEFRVVTYYHDGTGSWTTTAGSWAYYSLGTIVDTSGSIDTPLTTEVPASSGNFINNGKYDTLQWDGAGDIIDLLNQGSFFANGTSTTITNDETVEVPASSAVYYSTGRFELFLWDGTGGYTTSFPNGSFNPNGTYITDDGTDAYYWNGSGGYYSEPL
jgi:hypothetical protein